MANSVIDSEEFEIPVELGEAEILRLPEILIGKTPREAMLILADFTNVEALHIPETRQMLIEIDGEQRRAHKCKHYSMAIGGYSD